MKRREFIGKSVKTAVVGGAVLSSGGLNYALGKGVTSVDLTYDLVAVKGGAPGVMFDLAMNA